MPGEGVLHYGVRRRCAPALGSFWPENSGIGVCFYWKISVIGVYFHLEFNSLIFSSNTCSVSGEQISSSYFVFVENVL